MTYQQAMDYGFGSNFSEHIPAREALADQLNNGDGWHGTSADALDAADGILARWRLVPVERVLAEGDGDPA